MAIDEKAGFRSPLEAAGSAYYGIRGKIKLLNPAQKRLFFSLAFFLLVNAALLAVSIVVFSLLMKKL